VRRWRKSGAVRVGVVWLAWLSWLRCAEVRAQAGDADRDGVADATEDTNRNGRRDIGETDPRLADTDGDGTSDGREREQGTDPARNPLIDFPEPMLFDMVRGLGAERGELEANVLAHAALRAPGEVNWAPEIEYAFADWHAVELELGFTNSELKALKLGVQGTLRYRDGDAHGWQALVDFDPLDDALLTSLLYVGAVRVSPRISLVALIGPAVVADFQRAAHERASAGGAVNATLFVAAAARTTLGLESNLLFEHGLDLVRILPQWHQQIGSHLRVQSGVATATRSTSTQRRRRSASSWRSSC
jgi:hypothetical protein